MQDNPIQPHWCKGLEMLKAMPRCGAKCRTRSGLPCRSIAMSNGRCRMHGGTNKGAPCGIMHGKYKHGLYSKEVREKLKNYKAVLSETRKVIELS